MVSAARYRRRNHSPRVARTVAPILAPAAGAGPSSNRRAMMGLSSAAPMRSTARVIRRSITLSRLIARLSSSASRAGCAEPHERRLQRRRDRRRRTLRRRSKPERRSATISRLRRRRSGCVRLQVARQEMSSGESAMRRVFPAPAVDGRASRRASARAGDRHGPGVADTVLAPRLEPRAQVIGARSAGRPWASTPSTPGASSRRNGASACPRKSRGRPVSAAARTGPAPT